MKRSQILGFLAAVAAATAVSAAYVLSRLEAPSFHGTDLGPGVPAHDFELQAAGRGPVSLADYRGRVVLLFFGYTHCPDVCPLTLTRLRQAMDQLGDRREDVQVVLVTVDPELDTPTRLHEYVQAFDPSFIGLTGERAELEAVTRAFGIYVGEPEMPVTGGHDHNDHGADPHPGHAAHVPPARIIAHTSHVLGIDRRGDFRLLWSPDTPPDRIAQDVRRLLRS
jgi:protein SCO1